MMLQRLLVVGFAVAVRLPVSSHGTHHLNYGARMDDANMLLFMKAHIKNHHSILFSACIN